MKEEKKMVSVVMTTYNHEDYILDAIKGVAKQKFDGDIELILTNDCSTDTTDKVIRDYLESTQVPENITIRYTFHEKNKGAYENFLWSLGQVKGDFVAYCEGDDYWTDPFKIQKQVDCLSKNGDFVMVCTNFSDSERENNGRDEDVELRAFDILYYDPIRTLTVLFRASALQKMNLNQDALMGDLVMWLELIKIGRIIKLKDNTGHYRILEDSLSSRKDLDARIRFYENAVSIIGRYVHQFDLSKKEKKQILHERYSYLISLALKKSKKEALKFYKAYLTQCSYYNFQDFKYGLSLIFKA